MHPEMDITHSVLGLAPYYTIVHMINKWLSKTILQNRLFSLKVTVNDQCFQCFLFTSSWNAFKSKCHVIYVVPVATKIL